VDMRGLRDTCNAHQQHAEECGDPQPDRPRSSPKLVLGYASHAYVQYDVIYGQTDARTIEIASFVALRRQNFAT